nr:2920_t:CDS:2 [Entrophospora candida]
MPELPEVETVRQILRSEILGKIVQKIEIYKPKDETKIRKSMIKEIKRSKTHVLISHLGMTGKYFVEEKLITPEQKKLFNKHNSEEARVLTFHLGSKQSPTKLIYCDARRFGSFRLQSFEDYKKLKPYKNIGTDLLEETVDIDLLFKSYQKRKVPIKPALLDQDIISGIGNIYASEILFDTKIHPLKKTNQLTKLEVKNIVSSAQTILKKARNFEGTSEFDFNGKKYLLCNLAGHNISSSLVKYQTLLICPDDKSILASHIKNDPYAEVCFTVPVSNLKFRLNFHQRPKRTYPFSAFQIKDTNQVEKVELEKPSFQQMGKYPPAQFTFKVISQKKGEVDEKGEYKHELEIEPFSLGIEGLPEISRIIFDFSSPPTGAIEVVERIKDTWLYNTPELLTEKDNKALKFYSLHDFDLDSFQEKPAEDNSNNSPVYNALKTKMLQYYDTGEAKKHGQYNITDQNGEEVYLQEYLNFERTEERKFYKEIRAAIINNIKQNPAE